MKIAVVFLCLALASFIDTGNAQYVLTVQNVNVPSCVRIIYSIACKQEELQLLTGLGWNTQAHCILGDILYLVRCLAFELNCPVDYLLGCSGLSIDYINCILEGNVDLLLELKLDIDYLLEEILCLVEGLLGTLGYVLFDLVTKLTGDLGLEGVLPGCLKVLHLDLKGILASLSVTLKGVAVLVDGAVNTVGGLVGALLSVIGGVVGGVGSVLGSILRG
ncbi:uncharacterized protein [Dendrobates tinctorius]|uniref:uncharacterized protein n=1 Tax=Dendrobates tinctorius TaxID=92724 RepID=UPI003CC94839